MSTPAEAPTAPAVSPDTINPAQAPAPAAPAPAPTYTPAKPDEAAPVTPPVIGDPPSNEVDPNAPTSADADKAGVVTYEPTGDPGMDMALEFAGKLGLGMDDPAMAATVNGDWSLLEAKLASMGDKAAGWERMIELAKAADARFSEKRAAEAKAINDAVAGVLGDRTDAILAWAGKEATDAEKASINAMLRADPIQAHAASLLLKALYEQGAGNTVTPANATRDGSGSEPSQGDRTTLTRSQFAVEAGKLHQRYGAAYTQSSEYAALSARVR